MNFPIHSTRARVILAAALALALAGAGIALVRAVPRQPHASPAVIAAKQEVAARLDYPRPGPQCPPSVSTEYDAAKDRTRMVLRLRSVPSSCEVNGRVDVVDLVFRSEYEGQTRAPGHGELSVHATLSVVSSTPGVLAPSSPPAVFTADGTSISAKPTVPGKSGYRSTPKPQGVHESLAVRVPTKDLIQIAGARRVSARFGAATVTLSAAHLADLREFVARMNPNP